MKEVFRILGYLRFFKKEIAWNILFNLLYVVFSLFSFVALIPFLSILFGIIQPPLLCPEFAWSKDVLTDYISWHIHNYQLSHGMLPCLVWIGVVYLAFVFSAVLFRYLGMYFLSPIRNGLIERIRNDLYHKITILPLHFFKQKHRGDLLSRMTSDLAEVEWSVVSGLQMLIKDPLNVIIFLLFLIIASPKLSLFVLLVMPIMALLIRRIGASLKRNSTRGQEEMGKMMSHVEESLSGIKTIKSFRIEPFAQRLFEVYNNEYCRLMTKIFRRKELASPLTELFAVLSMLIVVSFGGYLVISNELHPSVLIAFVLVFARIISPLQAVTTMYYNLQKGNAAAQRIYDILDAPEKIEEVQNPISIYTFEKEIRYENVFFSYQDEASQRRDALKNIYTTIPVGSITALVGASGSGKTTMVNLLPRFYDITHGEIYIDEVAISQLNINQLRRLIGLVAQDSILFHDTILNNIAFGDAHPDLARVKAAARIAYADSFIEQLPQHYYTRLDDDGLNLSGGERQRLCIAREVYKNPPILILDEATSALDTESESMVQKALANLMKNRTTIIIAHRLSTVIHADKIIVLDNGEIIEEGTHAQLLSKQGKYAELIQLQML